MIQIKNILLVQGIARELRNENHFVTPGVGPIIAGLNSASFFGFQYDEKTMLKALPLVTRDDTDHTAMLEEAAEAIAANLRSRFESIKTVIVPLVHQICDKAHSEMSFSSAIDIMMERVYLNFQEVDTSIIDSPFFPKENFNNAVDFNNLDFAKYVPGVYSDISHEDAVALLKTSNDEINNLIADHVSQACYYFSDIFNRKEKEEIFDIIKKCRMQNIGGLFTFWLLLNKMVRTDAPIPQAQNLTLEDYRAGINYVLAATQNALISLAGVVRSAAAAGIALMNNKTKPSVEKGVPTVTGPSDVWYTNSAAEEIMKMGGTLSEAVYGYLYGTATNAIPVGFCVANAAQYLELYRKANSELSSIQSIGIGKKVMQHIVDCIEKFVADNTSIKAIVDQKFEKVLNRPEVPAYQRITYLLGEEVDNLRQALTRQLQNGGVDSLYNFIMESPLVIQLMRSIGLEQSANLILQTVMSQEGSELDVAALRANNTRAVINTITRELLATK